MIYRVKEKDQEQGQGQGERKQGQVVYTRQNIGIIFNILNSRKKTDVKTDKKTNKDRQRTEY